MPTLLLSPAGSGKTAHVIQRIAQSKAADPLAASLVIVPNQLQAADFRRRLAEAGGALGVEIVTFYTLYADILARAGKPIPALLGPVQIRLLRAIVDDLCARGVMRHYAALRARPGFVIALRNAIQELKRARVFPEDFADAVGGATRSSPADSALSNGGSPLHAPGDGGPHLRELSAVYTAYQDWLQKENWADPEGRGWLAAIALDENPTLGRDLRLLVVTGFDEFNPTQLGVLALLAPRARETLITLTGDANRPARSAHRRFHRARQALAAALDLHQVETLPVKPFLAPALAHLEANLFEPAKTSEGSEPSEVYFVEAQTRAVEARAALRWIKARIVRDGLALSDVAVMARSLEPYRPFLEETAAEFGIPLRIVGGLPLAQNPAVAALLSLLSLPAERCSVPPWPRRPLVEAWRSPYFDWSAQGITLADAAALDAASRQGRVVAGISQWREAFDLLERQKTWENVDEDGALARQGKGDRGLREKFDAFVALLTPPATAAVRDSVAFIENLIGDDLLFVPNPQSPFERENGLNVTACARANATTAGRDVAALRAFKDVLRGLTLAEAALGSPPLDYAAFYAELRGAVEAATYIAASSAGVLAISVLDARGLTFHAAALLGLSEGEFPKAEREDPFLSEADRLMLRQRGIPLESRLRGDEGTIFYQGVTRARQRLLLTRPYLADDGQQWEASPFWEQAHHLMGDPPVRRVRPEDAVSPAEAASLVELPQINETIHRGRAALHARLSPAAAGSYEGELHGLAQALTARYPASFGWSASKLEAYGTCPFYFYTAYALELEPRALPEEGYDVRMLGSMLHKILEDTYAQAADPTDLDDCLARVGEIAADVFAAAPAEYGFRPTPLWAQQQQELGRVLRQTITALAEQAQGFAPRYFEQKFGMGNPSLVLSTEIGEIRLHGYIDRVDADRAGRLRVVDYKAGGAAITARNLDEGRRLQLPLYALAARDALRLGEIAGGFYWHIQKAEASSLKLENYDGGVESACEMAVQHVTRHVANIRDGQFQPQPPADGCPSYCPASSFCWRYKSKGF